MTPVDWSAVVGVLFLVASGAVKWLIPGIIELIKPIPHNNSNGSSNGYKVALEAVNRTMGRLEADLGRTREAVGAVGASTGELRVQIAGLEPRVEVAIEEIARLRDHLSDVPEQITTAIGGFREEVDRRLGPIERRLENSERRMDATERRLGPDDRRTR